MKHTLIGLVIASLITALIAWLILPVLSFHFLSTVYLFLVFGVVLSVTGYITQFKKGMAQLPEDVTHLPSMVGGSVILLALVYLVVGLAGSSAIFNAQTKQQMLRVEELAFDQSIPNVDMANLILWDESDAMRFGEKLITEKDPTLGSMYQISEEYGTLSVVEGKPYWLFPLEHTDVFKYFKNKTIPGYIKVNATTGDSVFVDTSFSLSPSAFFKDDLKRRIYESYKTVGLMDYSFEEDHEGQPQWVVTVYTHKTWLSTKDVLGVVVVNPVSKDMAFYPVNEQPEWVDRVSAQGVFEDHLNDWGRLVKGWWNPSDQGKLRSTQGIGYVFKEGNLYFYTGMTSYGGDEATTGFIIYNPRTVKAEYYRLSGSTENKAMGLMEELVQNAGYTANYPYLININGEPTYLATLKGNSGNVVGYAMASVQNYRVVSWGKSLKEAQSDYNRQLIASGSQMTLEGQFDSLLEKKGTIKRVGAYTEGYYIVKLEGVQTLYLVAVDQHPTVALSEAGDQVNLSYLKTDETRLIDAIIFENKTLN